MKPPHCQKCQRNGWITFSINFKSWLFAVPGSPKSKIFISPRNVTPSGNLLREPPNNWHTKAFLISKIFFLISRTKWNQKMPEKSTHQKCQKNQLIKRCQKNQLIKKCQKNQLIKSARKKNPKKKYPDQTDRIDGPPPQSQILIPSCPYTEGAMLFANCWYKLGCFENWSHFGSSSRENSDWNLPKVSVWIPKTRT